MPRHLYVHIPFCHRICPYCSFHKHTPGRTDFRDFVHALVAETRSAARVHGLVPETVYFGGGTPTLLSLTHLGRLLDGLHDVLDLSGVREWTVEANPRTFGDAKANLLRAAGVTRVSLGVQSFDPTVLRTLGRDHSPVEAEEGFRILRAAGIPSINVDLMFATPGESPESWEATVDRAVALGPDHVSAYNLTFEEDTPFLERLARGEFSQDDERDAAFFEAGRRRLEAAGLLPYEISNYARPGAESLHNQAYWKGADYVGVGPGAVSTVSGRRWTSLPDTDRWITAVLAGAPERVHEEALDDAAFRLERLALLLRTRNGLPVAFLTERQRERCEELAEEGLVEEVEADVGPQADEPVNTKSTAEMEAETEAAAGGTVHATTPTRNQHQNRKHNRNLRLTPAGRLLADSVATHLAMVE